MAGELITIMFCSALVAPAVEEECQHRRFLVDSCTAYVARAETGPALAAFAQSLGLHPNGEARVFCGEVLKVSIPPLPTP